MCIISERLPSGHILILNQIEVCFKQSTTVAISMARPESSGDEIKPNVRGTYAQF